MRSPQTFFAFWLLAFLALSGCNCFQPVTEKQCDSVTECGSGWVCRSGVCFPPDGGGVGTGGGAGVGGGIGAGGGAGGSGGGGGTACSGCRDAAGACQSGVTSQRCGINGNVCRACSPNQVCAMGQCVTTGCSPASCPTGCCRNGVCVPPPQQSTAACGQQGATCQACGDGFGCVMGKCVTKPCNIMSCGGCCANGVCIPPGSQSAANCGVSGAQCKSCPAGQACQNGACATAPCGPATCGGCCVGNVCNAGTLPNACGKSGSVCTQCPAGQACTNGACGAPTYGGPCTSNANCSALGAGAICKLKTSSGNSLYTGGFCTRPCTAVAPCGSNGICLDNFSPYGEADPICAPTCASTASCRTPGYDCYPVQGNKACWIAPIPALLDGGFPDAGVPSNDGGTVGAACVSSAQCNLYPNGFCVTEQVPGLGPSGFTNGYCTSLCSGMMCSAGSTCTNVNGFGTINQQLCLRNCPAAMGGQSTCRVGYLCAGSGAAGTGVCTPNCTVTGFSCSSGQTCNTVSGYCN